MSEKLRMAEFFIGGHGQAAARALEELPAEIAGSLIDTISDPVSLSALKSMLPYHAARCLTAIPPAAGSKYLAALPPRDAAAILRHTDENSRETLIGLLPRRQALRVSLILGYPQSLVGAWIDPLTLTLPISGTVADAKKRIRNEGYEHSHVFIVDDRNSVRGFVSLVRLLLRAEDDALLSTLTERVPNTIRASTTLARAIDDKGWADRDVLPVVDRSDQFVGVLRYSELRRALIKPTITSHATESSDNLLGITEACYLGLAELMVTTLAEESDSAAEL